MSKKKKLTYISETKHGTIGRAKNYSHRVDKRVLKIHTTTKVFDVSTIDPCFMYHEGMGSVKLPVTKSTLGNNNINVLNLLKGSLIFQIHKGCINFNGNNFRIVGVEYEDDILDILLPASLASNHIDIIVGNDIFEALSTSNLPNKEVYLAPPLDSNKNTGPFGLPTFKKLIGDSITLIRGKRTYTLNRSVTIGSALMSFNNAFTLIP